MAIVVVGMLDEREEGLQLLKERIEGRRHHTILADISIGTGAIKPALQADIPCEDIAGAGGTTMEIVKGMLARQRDKATAIMAEGLCKKILELFQEGELQGMVAVGGTTGTFISLRALKALPFGLPKIIISSATAIPANAGKLSEYFSLRDIVVMHSVVDTVGMNPFVRRLMINGAGAICGMVEDYEPILKEKKPYIAITEFAQAVVDALHEAEG